MIGDSSRISAHELLAFLNFVRMTEHGAVQNSIDSGGFMMLLEALVVVFLILRGSCSLHAMWW